MQRNYFYYINVHGQLFLTETVPKNITSCFKHVAFLDFFYSRLRVSKNPIKHDLLVYEYNSPCGKEINHVYSEDAPIVFHSINYSTQHLIYAGSKTCLFQPSKLYLSKSTGRLYHPLPDKLYLPPPWSNTIENEPWTPNVGLIKSTLLNEFVQLGYLYICPQTNAFKFEYNNQEHYVNMIDTET